MTWFEVWSGMTHALIFFTEHSRAGLSRACKEGTAASTMEAMGPSSLFLSTSGCCTPSPERCCDSSWSSSRRENKNGCVAGATQKGQLLSPANSLGWLGAWHKAASRPSARLFCRQWHKGSFDVPRMSQAGLQPAPAPAAVSSHQPHLRVSPGTFLERPGWLGRSGRLLWIQPGLPWPAVLSLYCLHELVLPEVFSSQKTK